MPHFCVPPSPLRVYIYTLVYPALAQTWGLPPCVAPVRLCIPAQHAAVQPTNQPANQPTVQFRYLRSMQVWGKYRSKMTILISKEVLQNRRRTPLWIYNRDASERKEKDIQWPWDQ
ncbi:hypothetical protein PMIN06_010756 [Paraphaeosphaeria minitans]